MRCVTLAMIILTFDTYICVCVCVMWYDGMVHRMVPHKWDHLVVCQTRYSSNEQESGVLLECCGHPHTKTVVFLSWYCCRGHTTMALLFLSEHLRTETQQTTRENRCSIGMFALWMSDQQVLLGSSTVFVKFFNACWCETVRPLQFFFSCLHLSFLIHQRRLLYQKKCVSSNNVILQSLAKCGYDNIGALFDVYNFTVKDLIDLPVYRIRELTWYAFNSRPNSVLFLLLLCK